MSHQPLESLLGRPVDDVGVQELLGAFALGGEWREEDGRFYWVSTAAPVELLFDNEKHLEAIFLFAPDEDRPQVEGIAYPAGIAPGMSRDDVTEEMGRPSASGGGIRSLGMFLPPWDRFDFDRWQLHVQYSGEPPFVSQVTVQRSLAPL